MTRFQAATVGAWLDAAIGAIGAPLSGPYAMVGQFIAERVVSALRASQEADALSSATDAMAYRTEALSRASGTLIGAYMNESNSQVERVSRLVGALEDMMEPPDSDDTDYVIRARRDSPRRTVDQEEDPRVFLTQRHRRFGKLWSDLEASVGAMGDAVGVMNTVAAEAYAQLVTSFLAFKSEGRGGTGAGEVEFVGRVLPVPRGGVGVFPAVELSTFSLSDEVGDMTKEFVGQCTLNDLAKHGLGVTLHLHFNGVSRVFRQSATGSRNSPATQGLDRYRSDQPSPVGEADIPAVVWDILSSGKIGDRFPGRRVR